MFVRCVSTTVVSVMLFFVFRISIALLGRNVFWANSTWQVANYVAGR